MVSLKKKWKKKMLSSLTSLPPVCPEIWYGLGKILVKKKHTPVCPEFWYSLGKILVKKKHTPVCPEFWYGRGKILVK